MQPHAKRRYPIRRVILLAIAGLAISTAGCLGLVAAGAAAGGAAGYMYIKGKVCMEYPAPFTDTWTATHAALKSLGLPALGQENAGTRGTITSRTSDGTNVTVEVETQLSRLPAVPNLTRVCVRVGTWGDKPLSEQILTRIHQQFTPAPAGTTASVQPAWNAPAGSVSGIQPVGHVQAAETAAPPLLKGPAPR